MNEYAEISSSVAKTKILEIQNQWDYDWTNKKIKNLNIEDEFNDIDVSKINNNSPDENYQVKDLYDLVFGAENVNVKNIDKIPVVEEYLPEYNKTDEAKYLKTQAIVETIKEFLAFGLQPGQIDGILTIAAPMLYGMNLGIDIDKMSNFINNSKAKESLVDLSIFFKEKRDESLNTAKTVQQTLIDDLKNLKVNIAEFINNQETSVTEIIKTAYIYLNDFLLLKDCFIQSGLSLAVFKEKTIGELNISKPGNYSLWNITTFFESLKNLTNYNDLTNNEFEFFFYKEWSFLNLLTDILPIFKTKIVDLIKKPIREKMIKGFDISVEGQVLHFYLDKHKDKHYIHVDVQKPLQTTAWIDFSWEDNFIPLISQVVEYLIPAISEVFFSFSDIQNFNEILRETTQRMLHTFLEFLKNLGKAKVKLSIVSIGTVEKVLKELANFDLSKLIDSLDIFREGIDFNFECEGFINSLYNDNFLNTFLQGLFNNQKDTDVQNNIIKLFNLLSNEKIGSYEEFINKIDNAKIIGDDFAFTNLTKIFDYKFYANISIASLFQMISDSIDNEQYYLDITQISYLLENITKTISVFNKEGNKEDKYSGNVFELLKVATNPKYKNIIWSDFTFSYDATSEEKYKIWTLLHTILGLRSKTGNGSTKMFDNNGLLYALSKIVGPDVDKNSHGVNENMKTTSAIIAFVEKYFTNSVEVEKEKEQKYFKPIYSKSDWKIEIIETNSNAVRYFLRRGHVQHEKMQSQFEFKLSFMGNGFYELEYTG